MINLTLGLLAGALIGWAAFALFRFSALGGLLSSVLFGAMAGGAGTQLALVFRSAGPDGAPNVFALVMAVATAGACLIIARMITSR